MRPNTRMPTRVTLAMRVTHRERVLRAHHLFGTLAVGITGKIPSNSLIEQRAYDVQSALEAEEAALQRAGHLSPMLQAGFREAQRRVTEAGQTLRSRPARLRKWKELFRERRPVTRKLRCPIDVEKLEAYVASNESLELLQPRKGTAAAQTGRAIVQQFLQHVNREPNDQSTGWMELSYRHSEAGAQLVAAGFVVDSREYANGPDPFKLRKKLRAMALGRFGLDLDDSASFPRAVCEMLETGKTLAAMFLTQRQHIMESLGTGFFPHLANQGAAGMKEARDRVKLLFNLLDMDGTTHTWLEEPTDAGTTFRSEMAAGVTVAAARVRLLPQGGYAGQVFDLAAYIEEQPTRTQETARRMPLMLQMVQQLNEDFGKKQPFHERTLKSYLLQEAEGISRTAKLQWCAQHGCTAINLQHDGVVIRLTSDWTSSEAEAELSRVSTAASGYEQVVETKAWPPGIVFNAQLPARYADANGQGDDDESPCVQVLQTAFEYISGRDMIPGSRAQPRDATGQPENPWVSFQRRYNIPYLYGLIKTHKVPFGWRFISGGTDLAMNLIGDWMHASLSGLLDETHHLASKAMSGAWSQDPVPCLESFIIRDSRDVVRRIRDLETRRRAAYRAHTDGTATKPPHWRRVQFEVADFTTLYPSALTKLDDGEAG